MPVVVKVETPTQISPGSPFMELLAVIDERQKDSRNTLSLQPFARDTHNNYFIARKTIYLRDGPHFSAVLRVYKTYARGEGVRIHVRF